VALRTSIGEHNRIPARGTASALSVVTSNERLQMKNLDTIDLSRLETVTGGAGWGEVAESGSRGARAGASVGGVGSWSGSAASGAASGSAAGGSAGAAGSRWNGR
jgi:hypothetical protein